MILILIMSLILNLDLNLILILNRILIVFLILNKILILNLIVILNLTLLLQERKKANEVDRMVLVGDAKVCEYYGFLRSDSREWSINHDHRCA